jgi:REP element-mobilizing transposase RayT
MSRYTRRPKVEEEVFVHVMSRVVQRRFLVDDRGKEEMGRMLESQAAFAGLQVVTFCFLENHFHVLLRVDPGTAVREVGDEELVMRFRALYGSKRSPSLGVNAEMLEAVLKQSGERTERIRTQLKARMGDISVFMREFKTRFTKWYNENHNSVGTFWAERFRSVLVEPGSPALCAVAAYIDLNAVRAGLVKEPSDYAFCGLGLAARGNRKQIAAYKWLTRRIPVRKDAPKASSSKKLSEDVFKSYLKHVRRQLDLTTESPSMKADVAANRELIADFGCRGGALGSLRWVQTFCVGGGLMGFLRTRAPRKVQLAEPSAIHAARTCRPPVG